MTTRRLILLLFFSIFTLAGATSGGTAGEERRRPEIPPMSRTEEKYLAELNARFDAMSKLAQSHGHNHRLPKFHFVRVPKMAKGFHGKLTVGAIITAQGSIVIESGLEDLDDENQRLVFDALSLWRCQPPTIDDKPVNIRVNLPFEF